MYSRVQMYIVWFPHYWNSPRCPLIHANVLIKLYKLYLILLIYIFLIKGSQQISAFCFVLLFTLYSIYYFVATLNIINLKKWKNMPFMLMITKYQFKLFFRTHGKFIYTEHFLGKGVMNCCSKAQNTFGTEPNYNLQESNSTPSANQHAKFNMCFRDKPVNQRETDDWWASNALLNWQTIILKVTMQLFMSVTQMWFWMHYEQCEPSSKQQESSLHFSIFKMTVVHKHWRTWRWERTMHLPLVNSKFFLMRK